LVVFLGEISIEKKPIATTLTFEQYLYQLIIGRDVANRLESYRKKKLFFVGKVAGEICRTGNFIQG
jgi:hypothetical protein